MVFTETSNLQTLERWKWINICCKIPVAKRHPPEERALKHNTHNSPAPGFRLLWIVWEDLHLCSCRRSLRRQPWDRSLKTDHTKEAVSTYRDAYQQLHNNLSYDISDLSWTVNSLRCKETQLDLPDRTITSIFILYKHMIHIHLTSSFTLP